MPYSAVYKTQALAGLSILQTPSNVYLPQTSNTIGFSTSYLDKLYTPNISLSSMTFSSGGNFTSSNINITSNISGNALFIYSNALSYTSLSTVNISGNLAPFSNQTTVTSNLNIVSISAPNTIGVVQTSNLTSTTSITSPIFTGNAIIGYTNTFTATTFTSPFMVTNSNIRVNNLLTGISIQASNSIQAVSMNTTNQTLVSVNTPGTLFGSIVSGSITASNTIVASNLFGSLTGNASAQNANISSGTTSFLYSNILNSSVIQASNVTGNIITSTITMTYLSVMNVYSLNGASRITTTNLVSNIITGNIVGANNLSIGSVMYPVPIFANLSGNIQTTGNITSSYLFSTNFSIPILSYLTGSALLTTTAPTSNTSVRFPGTAGSYVNFGTGSSAKFDYNSSNLFVEAWVYLVSNVSNGTIIGEDTQKDGTVPYAYDFGLTNGNGALSMRLFNNIGTQIVSVAFTPLVSNTWNHIVYMVDSTNSKYNVAINGAWYSGLGYSYTGPLYSNVNSPIVIGGSIGNSFNGYIRDIRVIKGGNPPISNFTPATVPFGTGLPSYISGGTTVFSLYSQYLSGLVIYSGITSSPQNNIVTSQLTSNTISAQNVVSVKTTGSITAPTTTLTTGLYSNSISSPITISGNFVSQTTLTASNLIGEVNVNSIITTGTIYNSVYVTGNLLGSNNYTTTSLTSTSTTTLTNVYTGNLVFGNVAAYSIIGNFIGPISNSSVSIYSQNAIVSNGTITTIYTNTYTTNIYYSTINTISNSAYIDNLTLANLTVSNVNSSFTPASIITPYLTGTASVTSYAPTGNTAVSVPGGSYAGSTINFGSIYQTQSNYSTSNIFIEMWIYPQNTNGAVFSFGNSSTYNFTCNCNNPQLGMLVRNTDGTLGGSNLGLVPVTNAWQHFAFSLRISGANYILNAWLNGVSGTPSTVTGYTPAWFASDSMYIGGAYAYLNVNGYYRDVRVISGSTIPSGNFSPATVPFGTGLPSYVTGGTTVLSLYSQYLATPQSINYSLFSSYYPITPYLTGTASVTTTAPTGNTAVSVPSGSSGSSIVNFGSIYQTQSKYNTSNIFIEMWIYSQMTNGAVFSFSNSSSWNFICNCNNPPQMLIFVRNTDGTLGSNFGVFPNINAWQHLAFSLTISGANYILNTWLNGVSGTPSTVTGKTPAWFASDSMYIGGAYVNLNVSGYYRDVRVISGSTIPSGNFSPATVPFGTGLPSYVTGGTTVLSLYSQYLIPSLDINYKTDLDRVGIQNFPVYPQSVKYSLSNVYTPSSYVPSVTYYSTSGITGYNGTVLLTDGRVLLVPNTAPNIGFFNPMTNQFSLGPATSGFTGGVLLQNSSVALIPSSNTNMVVFDPNSGTITTTILLERGFSGGTLTPAGNVVCVPQTTSNIAEVNTTTGNVLSKTFGSGYYGAITDHQTGNVYIIPDTSSNLVSYTPGSQTTSNLYSTSGFRGAVYTPSDDIFLIPSSASSISNLIGASIVSANGYTTGCMSGGGRIVMSKSGTIGIYDGSLKTIGVQAGYTSPVAVPDGRVVFAPQTATGGVMVLDSISPLPSILCISPYFNKL